MWPHKFARVDANVAASIIRSAEKRAEEGRLQILRIPGTDPLLGRLGRRMNLATQRFQVLLVLPCRFALVSATLSVHLTGGKVHPEHDLVGRGARLEKP